jgi:aspartate kinase
MRTTDKTVNEQAADVDESAADALSIDEIKRVISHTERKKIVVFKFGGTTAGSDSVDQRLRDARLLIEQKLKDGYFAIPVFSAFKRLGNDRQAKLGMTDLLLSYRDIIAEGATERDGVKEFRRQILKPHLEQMRDLELLPADLDLEEIQKTGFKGMPKGLPKESVKMLEEFLRELNSIVGDSATFNKFLPSQGAIDHMVSGGERLMVLIIGAYFNKKWKESGFEWKAIPATARDIGVMTDGRFGDATILDESLRSIHANANIFRKRHEVPIVTGFDGVYKTVDNQGRVRRYTTTLGRSGSDLTATYIGYALTSEATYLVKDTDGVLSADPRYVPEAKTIKSLSYELAVEAGNIMTKAVQPAVDGNMDLIVMNPKNPSVFTTIGPKIDKTGPVLITNPARCRYVRVTMHGAMDLDKFLDEIKEYHESFLEFYYTGDHISFVYKGTKLPVPLDRFLAEQQRLTVEETPAYFFQVVGYMSRDDVVNFNAWLAQRKHLSGPRWFENSKSMNVCLPEEGTDIGVALQDIHAKFIQ